MPDVAAAPAALQVIVPADLGPEAMQALAASPFGPFQALPLGGRETVLQRLAGSACDALILRDDDAAADIAGAAGTDLAILVVVSEPTPACLLAWLGRGAQDVLAEPDLAAPDLARRLRAAIERKRREHEVRTAYATDLDTGLPHQQQLIEHMSQLLALREREPAPMAVLVLRIEGLAAAEAHHGREASNVLRRKIGVRLRAGVRASDVVASIGDDTFAVLLGSVLSPADAERVGAKLTRALMEPLRIAGAEVAVASALGIGVYPEDGNQPEQLLRRAVGLAAGAQAQGRLGFANFAEAGALPGAANDD